MAYKIGLIGTHGTGKTTLAALVSGELKKAGIEAKFIGEVATEAKEKGLAINEKTTIQAQMWILYTQFAAELVLGTERHDRPNYQVLICDRGPDNYCYLEHNVGRDEDALQMILNHARNFPYDRLYLLPITESGIRGGAGTRSVNPGFQKDMDNKIRSFLAEQSFDYIELPITQDKNPRDEWVRLVVNQTIQDLRLPNHLLM